MLQAKELFLSVEGTEHEVSALWLRPKKPKAVFVFGHGAGAGMRHPFMEDVSLFLHELGVATLRYHFPYMEQGRKRPDHKSTLMLTIRSAVNTARKLAVDIPLFAGGKSMGGRMTSTAQAEDPLQQVEGLIFLGFPLHKAKEPDSKRAQHLTDIRIPMLFLQGTRDDLADLSLLAPVVKQLGRRGALAVIEGADHSFSVLRKSGRTDEEILNELAVTMSDWIDQTRR
ncbi:MAG: alpha/beta hydrolase [Gemmatimonadota bacterium]|nr:alpha/beta hydrolase [Gemmatimonadota bacterium]